MRDRNLAALPEAGAEPCRILAVNPNGNASVSDLVRLCADRVLGPGTRAEVLHPAGSPHSIESADDRRVAEPLAIELLARHGGYDAYVMACFDDIAIAAGRRRLRAPVVGAAEAAVAAARCLADSFAVVTTVEAMVPGIRRLLIGLGVAERCSVYATGLGVAAAAGTGTQVDDSLDAAIGRARADGAEAIILGSGGLTGRADGLAARHGLPVIDAVAAALVLAEAVARLQVGQRKG